ncbi:hypothetical protein [Thiorhodococcus minor]|uniref:Uncharacterized protein n=1 Tax=Thiorhodococcus minor TaxID=57489 RepID=A0A6M0K2M9_9GAMM|nr:hypothetical protein [Thiorhodococcus minor]NEV64012.1 hypothetical protein [Thiorhodococcus minor]
MPSRSANWILIACALVIGLGLGVLAIDRWVVKRDLPPKEQQLAALAEDFGLTLRDDDVSLAELRALLSPFAATTGAPDRIGPALSRSDGERLLWLFEYSSRETAIARVGKPDVHAEVTLFGILLDLGPGPDLPAWSQAEDSRPPAPPHTVDSIARLARLDGYRMAMHGRRVLFVSTLQTWALKQVAEQRTSAELHPGLFNSAMKVEVQLALDTVNAMDLDMAPLDRFYQIDIGPIDLPKPDASGLRSALEESSRQAKEQLDRDMAELRERMARQREENRARFEARLQQFRDNAGVGNERLERAEAAPEAPALAEPADRGQ